MEEEVEKREKTRRRDEERVPGGEETEMGKR